MKAELRLKKIERREDDGFSFYYHPFIYHYQFTDKSWWLSTHLRMSDTDVAWLVAHMRRSLERLGLSSWGELSVDQFDSIVWPAFKDLRDPMIE